MPWRYLVELCLRHMYTWEVRAVRQSDYISDGHFTFWTETAMSNPHRSYLPPEILDRIVDYLHYQRETLNQCCLVSKSWIPRTRKHLFAELYFSYECDHKAWKKAFPDCSRSPVHHTHTLRLDILKNIVAWSAEEDIWIPIFSRVLSSGLNGCHKKTEIRLDPFYTFSSSLKSLRVVTLGVPSPTMFDGVWSIRLLENLTSIVQNISTIRCTWYYEQDLRWIAALLAGCPDTLECVDIECRPYRTLPRFGLVPDWNLY